MQYFRREKKKKKFHFQDDTFSVSGVTTTSSNHATKTIKKQQKKRNVFFSKTVKQKKPLPNKKFLAFCYTATKEFQTNSQKIIYISKVHRDQKESHWSTFTFEQKRSQKCFDIFITFLTTKENYCWSFWLQPFGQQWDLL